ncbi:hypothetical protein HEP_00202600, partial [Hepatocystis sp. ex Piliocolobus tephrosceles]
MINEKNVKSVTPAQVITKNDNNNNNNNNNVGSSNINDSNSYYSLDDENTNHAKFMQTFRNRTSIKVRKPPTLSLKSKLYTIKKLLGHKSKAQNIENDSGTNNEPVNTTISKTNNNKLIMEKKKKNEKKLSKKHTSILYTKKNKNNLSFLQIKTNRKKKKIININTNVNNKSGTYLNISNRTHDEVEGNKINNLKSTVTTKNECGQSESSDYFDYEKKDEKKDENKDVNKDLKNDENKDLKNDENKDVKKDVKKDVNKDVKKDENKDIKKDENKNVKKDENKDVKKDENKDVKKDENKDVKKDENKDVKKDENKDVNKDVKKDEKNDYGPLENDNNMYSWGLTNKMNPCYSKSSMKESSHVSNRIDHITSCKYNSESNLNNEKKEYTKNGDTNLQNTNYGVNNDYIIYKDYTFTCNSDNNTGSNSSGDSADTVNGSNGSKDLEKNTTYNATWDYTGQVKSNINEKKIPSNDSIHISKQVEKNDEKYNSENYDIAGNITSEKCMPNGKNTETEYIQTG